jgi:hypothetical protein
VAGRTMMFVQMTSRGDCRWCPPLHRPWPAGGAQLTGQHLRLHAQCRRSGGHQQHLNEQRECISINSYTSAPRLCLVT